MIKRIAGLDSDQTKKTISADVVNDAQEEATIEFFDGSDPTRVFASVTVEVSPPLTTVVANYTVDGDADPHFVTARAGDVESEPTALALGGTPVKL